MMKIILLAIYWDLNKKLNIIYTIDNKFQLTFLMHFSNHRCPPMRT